MGNDSSDDGAREDLLWSVDDPSADVQVEALHAVRLVEPSPDEWRTIRDRVRALASNLDDVGIAAAKLLAAMGDEHAPGALVEHAKRFASSLRSAVADASDQADLHGRYAKQLGKLTASLVACSAGLAASATAAQVRGIADVLDTTKEIERTVSGRSRVREASAWLALALARSGGGIEALSDAVAHRAYPFSNGLASSDQVALLAAARAGELPVAALRDAIPDVNTWPLGGLLLIDHHGDLLEERIAATLREINSKEEAPDRVRLVRLRNEAENLIVARLLLPAPAAGPTIGSVAAFAQARAEEDVELWLPLAFWLAYEVAREGDPEPLTHLVPRYLHPDSAVMRGQLAWVRAEAPLPDDVRARLWSALGDDVASLDAAALRILFSPEFSSTESRPPAPPARGRVEIPRASVVEWITQFQREGTLDAKVVHDLHALRAHPGKLTPTFFRLAAEHPHPVMVSALTVDLFGDSLIDHRPVVHELFDAYRDRWNTGHGLYMEHVLWAASFSEPSEIVHAAARSLRSPYEQERLVAARFVHRTLAYREGWQNLAGAPMGFGGPATEKPPAFTESTTGRLPRYADLVVYEDHPEPALVDNSALVEGLSYLLEVAIRVRPAGIQPEGPRRPIHEPGLASPVTLYVSADGGPGIEVDEPVASLQLPPDGDSDSAIFRFSPLRPGPATITVRMYCKWNLLEVVTLRAAVVSHDEDPRAVRHPLSIRQERLDYEYEGLETLEPRGLNIDVTRRGSSYILQFAFNVSEHEKVRFSARIDLSASALESNLADVRALWCDIALGTPFASAVQLDDDKFQHHLRRLATVGRSLYVAIFRQEPDAAATRVGELLRDSPPPLGSTVQVTIADNARDFVFPWSLLYDKPLSQDPQELVDADGFWGVRWVVEQLPQTPPRLRPPTVEQRELPIRLGFMLWKDFRNAADQRELLRRFEADAEGALVAGNPITDAAACADVIQQDVCDLLYFYAHGHARVPASHAGPAPTEVFRKRFERLDINDPLRGEWQFLYDSIARKEFEPDRTYIELTSKKLYLNEVEDELLYTRFTKEPIVILNLCESAQLMPSLSDSFVRFFLIHGASAVIGTESPMTVSFAHPFAESLLARLLSGEPIGPALRSVRRQFLDLGNPLGLSYTLYGSASARLSPPALGTAS